MSAFASGSVARVPDQHAVMATWIVHAIPSLMSATGLSSPARFVNLTSAGDKSSASLFSPVRIVKDRA